MILQLIDQTGNKGGFTRTTEAGHTNTQPLLAKGLCALGHLLEPVRTFILHAAGTPQIVYGL
ncbi:hypothetical protein YSKK_26520 [Halopseudomonas aestusnigri]|nr:hypothetical protein MFKK_30970 [Halopseudomonas aestusnigri]GMQ54789.1 hypothetical protein YSKK_26520 [Halopseudomonas aestusnigri]